MHYGRDFGIETRIARFHNIYGPQGTWKGGREKAPAAFARKVRPSFCPYGWGQAAGSLCLCSFSFFFSRFLSFLFVQSISSRRYQASVFPFVFSRFLPQMAVAKDGDEVEMWGDGKQTRSFCYIDDCVEGILRLMRSDYKKPLNIGSDEMVSMNDMMLVRGACSAV